MGKSSQTAGRAYELWLELEGCFDQGAQFFGGGVPAGLVFRVDELVADHHFKGTAAAGDQGPRFDLGFKLFDQFCRDTHDFGGIVSSGAVFDRDFGLCHPVSP